MSYNAWSVIFGEVVSAAKWNILGTNDAAFNSGGGVLGSGLATDAITLGYAQITSPFVGSATTSDQDITSLATTVTIPSGGRRIKITAFIWYAGSSSAASSSLEIKIKDGATVLAGQLVSTAGVSYGSPFNVMYSAVIAAGSHTYKVAVSNAGAGSPTVWAAATQPSFILVELI